MMKKITGLILVFALIFSQSAYIFAEGNEENKEAPWWENWIRMIDNTNFDSAHANAAVSGDLWNAGQGTFYVNTLISKTGREAAMNAEKAKDNHYMAWVELQGDSRCMIGAVHNLGNGSYEMDAVTGQPKLIADPWSWASKGPDVNADANEVVWISAAAMVNNEPWQGDFIWPEDGMLPTYPDGSSALGWLNDNHMDPRNYKLYDAMAQKDINGDLRVNEASWQKADATTDPSTLWGPVVQNADGTYNYTTNFYFSKDVASPWWLEYNRYAVRQLLENGVEGFWVDNYGGWDYINSTPTQKGFGEWSVAKFRDYIKEHNDVLKIENPDEFDIRVYLKNTFREKFPNGDPDNPNDGNWTNMYWMTDTIWRGYCAFKADVAHKTMVDFYSMVKEEAKNLGLDPDQILVSGNDISHLNFGGEKSTQLDIISVEHSTLGWTPDRRFYSDGIAPEGQSGTAYKTMLAYQKGQMTCPWYYMDARFISYNNLAEVESYYALANNAVIKIGGRSPGNAETRIKINKNVDKMGNVFQIRRPYVKVAMVHSPQTQSFYWVPREQPFNGKVPHTLDFNGWGCVLEENNVGYKVITDYNIDAEHLEGIELLVLPTITCISDEKIAEIKKFLDRGGKILMSGSDSGLRYTSDNIWQERESAALVDLAKSEKYGSQIHYIDQNPGVDYYIYKNSTYNVDKSFDYLFILDTTYQVGTPVFKNQADEKVSGMSGVTTLKTTFDFKNNDLENIDVTVYAQVCDENGWTVKTVSKDYVARANVVENFAIDVDLPENPEQYTVNIFVWKGTQPITVNMSFPQTRKQKTMTNVTSIELETESLIDNGFIPRDYEIYGFNSYVRSAMWKQEDENKYFLDLVNTNYDLETDVITEAAGGIVDVKIDGNAKFYFHDIDKDEKTAVNAERIGDKYRVTVPGFRVYGSLEIDVSSQ